MQDQHNVQSRESEQSVEQESPAAAELHLYDKQLKSYRTILEQDWEEAVSIYGLWQVHSLSPDEKMKFFEKCGMKPIQAQEMYNLGVRAVLAGNYKKAENHFKQSIEENPDFNDAIYNLALTYEHLGNFSKALDLWQLYQERIGSRHPDYVSVRSHIRTLKKKAESND